MSCNSGIDNLATVNLKTQSNSSINKNEFSGEDNFSILNNSLSEKPPLNPDWMANMADVIGNKSLRNIVIPGAHDSATAYITEKSDMANDNAIDSTISIIESLKEKILKLPFFKDKTPDSALKKIIAPWSRAQDKSISEQLEAGIRYFDLRVLRRPNGQMFIIHGFYSINIDSVLNDLKNFTEKHPKEIILLDFNHLFHLESNHEDLIRKINNAFTGMDNSSRLIPGNKTVNVTMNQLWQSKQQVIALYDDQESVNKHPELWSQSSIFSPWPNKQDVSSLTNDLDNILSGKLFNNTKHNFDCLKSPEQCRKVTKDSFFVLQGVQTPDAKMILNGFAAAHSLKTAEEDLKASQLELDNINKKLTEVKNKYDKMFFLLKPFYGFEIDILYHEKNLKELKISADKNALIRARSKYDKTPQSLEQLAHITTPVITAAIKNEWAAKDLNIIIADWFEISDYVETIKNLNIQRP